MKGRFGVAFIYTAMIMAASGFCAEPAPYIEYQKYGSINWTRGIIHAIGFGKPDETGSTKPLDASVKALYHAKKNARRHLIDIVRKIQIDSHGSISKIADTNYSISAKINEMIFEAQEIERLRRSRADGTVEVHLQLNLYGGLSQLVLPQEIRQIESIKHVRTAKKKSFQQTGTSSTAEIFTGLVIDARGIPVVPALVPRLLDENGQAVFGAAFASREFAVQWGMSSYTTDNHASLRSQRVGWNPLFVRGLRTLEPGHSDIIISNTDAAKLLSSSQHLLFLKECRVIIVLDPPAK
jgi:hypothetical protein